MHAFATLSVSLCVLSLISFGIAAPTSNSYDEHKSIECHKDKRYYKDEYGKTEECYKYNYDPNKDLLHGSSEPAECHKDKRYYKSESGKVDDCYKYRYDPKEDFPHESPRPIECHKGNRYYKSESGKIEDCYKYKYDPKEEFLHKSPKPIECSKGERYYKSKDGKLEECPKHKSNSKKGSLRARADPFLSFNNTVPSYNESGTPQTNGDGSAVGNGGRSGSGKSGYYFRESDLGYGYNVFYYNDDADHEKTTLPADTTIITVEPTGATSPEVIPDGEELTGLLGGLL